MPQTKSNQAASPLRVPVDTGLGVFDIEAFLASGVIVLYNEKISDTSRSRSIEVLKLRGSKHSSRFHSMRITDEGIRV